MSFIEVVVAFVNLMLVFESPEFDLYSSCYGPFLGAVAA